MLTRDEFRMKGLKLALASFLIPFVGVAAFYIKPLAALAPIIFLAGPFLLVALFIRVKYKEKKIAWKKYRCPYCGEFFEAEPKPGEVKHLICRHTVYIDDDRQ